MTISDERLREWALSTRERYFSVEDELLPLLISAVRPLLAEAVAQERVAWEHPVASVPEGYVYIAAGAKGVYTHTDQSDWYYTYPLPTADEGG